MRRYDIDWIRVIAIGLLIVYHSAVAFQSWGIMIGFITTAEPWPGLWIPMAVLNVWRIPLLFFVSGMGVYFAMQSRTWLQLITERSRRIFVPYLFGMFVIVPIQLLIWRSYYNMELIYVFNPAHLWFLGNIMAYVVIFFQLFYYLKNKNIISKIFASPFSILIPMAFLMAEKLIINPNPYEMYAMTLHGFFLGLIAFFFGFCFATAGTSFWDMLTKIWWVLLIVAVTLCVGRIAFYFSYLIPVESVCWVLLVFAAGYKFLNRPSSVLKYLSEAAYPVYILHMIFQFLISLWIFPLEIPLAIKFVLLVVLTLSGCLLTYEIIKRTKVTRFLFGLRTSNLERSKPGPR
jgi:glucan biosynthesis protein C